MVARIRTYIERAFADAPKSKKSTELQEELISNMIEKYNDQLKLGKTEEEAYTAVIAGLGDIGGAGGWPARPPGAVAADSGGA